MWQRWHKPSLAELPKHRHHWVEDASAEEIKHCILASDLMPRFVRTALDINGRTVHVYEVDIHQSAEDRLAEVIRVNRSPNPP